MKLWRDVGERMWASLIGQRERDLYEMGLPTIYDCRLCGPDHYCVGPHTPYWS